MVLFGLVTGPSVNDVERWLADLERELREIDAALGPLVERQVAVTERLGLLKRLLASLTTKDVGSAAAATAVTTSGPVTHTNGSIRERVQAHAAEILGQVGRPLHINEIHAEFLKRGFEVPGAGKPNNITVHLSDADGIVSTARGYYATKHPKQSDSGVRYPVVDESRGKRAHG